MSVQGSTHLQLDVVKNTRNKMKANFFSTLGTVKNSFYGKGEIWKRLNGPQSKNRWLPAPIIIKVAGLSC